MGTSFIGWRDKARVNIRSAESFIPLTARQAKRDRKKQNKWKK
jgi:hypothetical protein